MSDMRRWFWSGWARVAISGAALGLMLLTSGDRARAAISIGINPLLVLKLQVRPNVIVVLDSSGSMNEDLTGNALGDDHTTSKMGQAKVVLNTFIANNQTAVSFQFGTYSQGSSTLTGSDRFLYTSTDPLAAPIQVNPGGSGISAGRLKRNQCLAVPAVPGSVCGDTQINVDGSPIHKVKTGRFFNGEVVRFLAGGTYCSTTAGTPTNPATLILQQTAGGACGGAATGAAVRFTFQGVEGGWAVGSSSFSCSGFFSLVNLQPCSNLDQISLIGPFLRPALDTLSTGNGSIAGYAEDVSFNLTSQPTVNGIRAGGFTPIAESIIDIKTYFNDYYNGGPLLPAGLTAIKNQNPKQRTFMIFVTDGDDTCQADQTSGGNVDLNALRAAHKAELLFRRIVPTDPASGVPSFLILLGNGADKRRGDTIAFGGSGMSIAPTGADNVPATRWSAFPTPAQINACTTCRPAFAADTAQDLADALTSVINQVVGQGEFSASAPIIGTVFELVVDPNLLDNVVVSPLNPTTRYSQRINILYQSVFDLPKWEGRLFAFRNDGSFQVVGTANTLGIWEAGQTLFDKVTTVMKNTNVGHGNDEFTFAELHGGASARAIGSAVIKRRIFTSNGNGTFSRTATGLNPNDPQFVASAATGSNVVALWPPNQTGVSSGIAPIDPAAGTAGPLDTALGISTLTYLQLQAQFGACLASTDAGFGPAPTACDVVANAALALNTARKEAREIILAWIAGAQIDKGTDGKPVRLPVATSEPNALLYSSRGWLLQDTVNSAVVVATPPLQFSPTQHVSEFVLYRDGRRNNDGQGIDELDLGFGLRNPDFDDLTPQTKLNLKPVMTVVYLGASDGVHAFRAGPECVSATDCTSGEQGSEELWSFVPYDQLSKIQDLMAGQITNPHIYMIGSSLRLASVFIPDSDGFDAGGAGSLAHFNGRWRTVLFFGRGPGGKYYTALDVTVPGRFTKTKALDTSPPWVMWSRGNPDTKDGTAAGANNNNATDRAFFADMGESWSIPAVGSVQRAFLGGVVCPVTTQEAEWRVFVGSGYGDTAVNPREGKRFYQLDAITGNVCQTSLLPNTATNTYAIENALVAGPSGYNPKAQDPPGSTTRDPIDFVTRIYQPDINGRIWRFSTESGGLLYDAGAAQPFGDSVALLKITNGTTGVASVFASAGNDDRVPDSAGPFRAYGVKDPLPETTYTPPPLGTLISGFPFNLDTVPPSAQRIRGTVQPATFFNESGKPRVFFAGTRFIPAGVGSCLSSFDTILFAVSGNTAGAVYDFTGDNVADLYTVLQGNRTTGITSGGGSVVLGESGALASAPTPTPNPSPTPTPGPPKPPTILSTNLRTNSPVCRTP